MSDGFFLTNDEFQLVSMFFSHAIALAGNIELALNPSQTRHRRMELIWKQG